jgi:hypothetical protein
MTTQASAEAELSPSPTSRRAWRIAARGLLILVPIALVAAAVSFWMEYGAHLGAVAYLRTLGATVSWDWDEGGWRRSIRTSVTFGRGFGGLFPRINEDDLAQLRRLKHLDSLDLSMCDALTNQGLAHLSGLTELRTLDLGRSPYPGIVTHPSLGDVGLVHLRGLRRLESLSLIDCAVTDAGLANLAGLTALQDLDLRGTQVTDAGLVHLKGLRRLKSMNLEGTKVTPEAIAAFLESRPELDVTSGPLNR